MTQELPAESLRARLRDDLRAAMKAQRRDEMAALRELIAAIDNAESVEGASQAPSTSSQHIARAVRGLRGGEVARRSLSVHELQRIIETELWERDAQAERLERLGRSDEATRLRAEAAVIARYESTES